MKIFKYIKWKVKDYTFTDWAFMFSACCFGAYIPARNTDSGLILFALSVGTASILMFKIFINQLKKDYNNFCEEEQQLFEIIKKSDEKV
jgi:hypothetical protein